MLPSLHDLVVRQFREAPPDVRLLIFNPNYVYQNFALDTILRGRDAVYVRLNGSRLSRDDVNAQIEAAYQRQMDAVPLKDVPLLVIDEIDRMDDHQLNALLPDLVQQTRGRLVLLGRRVPAIVLDDGALRRMTRFIPKAESLMLWDYSDRNGESGMLLEVRALGTGRVLLNGKPIDSWDGVLPRSLFFFLVDRGMTTRSEIFETFWPNLSTREATNVFHVTKRKISEVLGTDLTAYWSGFYRIASHIHLSYDAVRFSEMVQDSAILPSDESAVMLKEAASLYRGNFLTSISMGWVDKRRDELQQTYCEALVGVAKVHERQGDTGEALGYYLRAINTSPQREDLALSAMKIYRDMGNPGDALSVYERLERELKQGLGVAPAPHVREFADSVRRLLDADGQG